MTQKENGNVIKLIIGLGTLLLFLYIINPPFREASGIYLIMLGLTWLIYSSKVYQDELIGINKRNLGKSFFWAFLIGVGFYVLSSLVPGLSLGLPTLPGAVSDGLKFFTVVFVASIAEELFFRGGLLGYIKKFSPSKRQIWLAIIIQAVAFSLFHLGAYISGLYAYPDFATALTAINANISSFIVAFIFGILSGYIVSRDGIRNLVFSIILHIIFNFIIYTKLVVLIS